MFRVEKTVDSAIQKIVRKNILESENEQQYWDRHWKEQIKLYERNGIPEEIRDIWWKNLYDEMLEHYTELLGTLDGKTVCELGCGSGYSSLMMATKNAKVTLVDFAELSSAYSKKVCDYMKINPDEVNFITGDAFSEELEIGKFDVVWNCGVAEHYQWNEAVKLISIMAKHAKKGGKVMVTLPNLLSPYLLYCMHKEGKGSEIFYSHRQLKRIMEEAGLQDVKVLPINYWVPSCFPKEWANKMRKHRLWHPFRGLGWLFTGIGVKQ